MMKAVPCWIGFTSACIIMELLNIYLLNYSNQNNQINYVKKNHIPAIGILFEKIHKSYSDIYDQFSLLLIEVCV